MATQISFHCPECAHRIRSSSEHIGRKGRCPTCRSLVEVTSDIDCKTDGPPVTPEQSSPGGRASQCGPTDVTAWLACLIGVGLTTGLYMGLFFPLRNTSLGILFMERGIIPLVIVLITSWGFATLLLKYMAVKKQQHYSELELELIPLDVGLQITPQNVDQFLQHLAVLPHPQQVSILGRRIQGALEHFKFRGNVPEVQGYLATQAELDASGVDAGYTLLRAFIWAVPILGFIGTVMGISSAVSGLGMTLDGGGDIMTGLGQVTGGLSTAFDTTLIALVMAIFLLFPTEWLRKSEYRMLNRMEAFANESILRRMATENCDTTLENMPRIVRHTLKSAFEEHQCWLAQWQAQVANLGQAIGRDFEKVLTHVQHELAEGQSQVAEQLKRTNDQFGVAAEQMSSTTDSFGDLACQLADRMEKWLTLDHKLDQRLTECVTQFHSADVERNGQETHDRNADVVKRRRLLGMWRRRS